jgi:glucose-6-phosphate dehydrogenase assembly protein OpcA
VSQNLEPVTLGEPREANVASLSAELDALWRSASGDSAGHAAVTRACALTLLVFTESEEGASDFSNLLGTLTLQNPCRALILVVRPEDQPAGVTAWISAVCQLPAPGEKQVCCEHVTIIARGDRVLDLDKVVVPLMVSGLPVGLWWRVGRATQIEQFEKILRYVDRVYVDSEWFPDPEAGLPVLAEVIRKSSGRTTITDLNWARLTPWRELAAECFDSSDTRPYLNRINEVWIEYRKGAPKVNHCLGQGLLFAAWMAGRLGWEAGGALPGGEGRPGTVEGQGRAFRFQGRPGEIRVHLVPQSGGPACSSGFLSVELTATGKSASTFSLICGSDSRSVVTRITLPNRPPVERTSCLEVFDEVGLLNEELKFASRDRIYEEALVMVASMTR